MKTNKWISAMLVAILACMMSAKASVLTFDVEGLGNNTALPQNYGDYVTSTSMWTYTYGEAGEGFTPNVSVEYIGGAGGSYAEDLTFWATDFGDLVNVVENEDDAERWTIIRFTADEGCQVVLHSMDMGNYLSSGILIDSIAITNESGTVLFQTNNFVLGANYTGHASINFGAVTGQVLTLALDLQTADRDNDCVALDNIVFSQVGSASSGLPSITPTAVIDFEDYSAGVAPPAPWISRDSEDVDVSSTQAKSGTQSLAIAPDSAEAVYPVVVQSNQTASFSVWIRPANNLYNEYMGGVEVEERDATDYWYATHGVAFEHDFFATPEDGETLKHLRFYGTDVSTRYVGDFTPETWYLVQCEITTSQIVYTVTVDTGTYVHSFDRPAGYTVKEIQLQGRQFDNGDPSEQVVYFDDFTYTAPPEPATLTVSSAYGDPVPAGGAHDYFVGDVVTCQVASVTQSLTNWSASGWTATGHNPASGSGNQAVLTLAGDTELTWNWQTNYWLDISVSGSGTVSHAEGWYVKDDVLELIQYPSPGWLFMGWSGDAYGTNQFILTMDEPKSVVAIFSDDADGDGLTNTEEANIGSNPWKTDTDDDGFDDAFEVAQGLSPTNNNASIVSYIANHDGTFGLYPSNAVLDVAVGQVALNIDGTTARLRLQMEQSEDLVTWTNAGDAVEWTMSVDGSKKFLRVRNAPAN